jgi:hypothetical protein
MLLLVNRNFWIPSSKWNNEIGSCILKYLRFTDPNVQYAIFYSDSCLGQNYNQYVSSLLLYAVGRLPIETINHKFFVPRHTMTKCDRIHSANEHAQKHLAIYSVHDRMNGKLSARRHKLYSVNVLEHTDIHDLKALASELICNRRKTSTFNRSGPQHPLDLLPTGRSW